MKKHLHLIVLLLIAITLFVFSTFSQKGFFVTDDGDWMVIRFSAFHQTLRDGEFPVRFLSRLNNEYGYPVSTFLYPGPFYLAEPFHLIGFSFIDSIKLLFALSFTLSGVFIFLWLRKFFDVWSSIIGSLFYMYAPYHLYDYYKRGSLGEMTALAIIPFILWQLERKSLLWTSLSLGLLIISHNTLAALFLLFFVGYCMFDIYIDKHKKQKAIFYGKMLLFALGLSAFFWVPVLLELQYTVFSKTNVSNWREYFAPLSLLGYSTIFITGFTSLLFISKKITLKKHRLTLVLLILTFVTLFLASPISSFIWNILPISFIQFPFRVLSLTLVSVAFLTACSLSVFKGKTKLFVGGVFIIVLLISAIPYATPSGYTQRDEGFYTTNMDTTTVKNEYMPVWVKEIPTKRADQKVEIISGNGSISDIVVKSNKVQFKVDIKDSSTIQINTIYWPGWKVVVNEKETPISYTNNNGVMQIKLAAGTYVVTASFHETLTRLLSDIISILSFVILLLVSLKAKHGKV